MLSLGMTASFAFTYNKARTLPTSITTACKIALRAPNRPEKPEPSTRRRGAYREVKSVSVTMSIGVAERSAKLATPDDVLKAADEALYRAKSKGRNQVSR